MIKSTVTVARTLTAVALTAVVSSVAAQQAYPSKPIRFVVPYPPGGATDPLARMVAQKLADKWGQQVIVDNRPGGNTVIGTDAVAKAPPDGYTILLATSPLVTGPSLVPNLPYDTIKDFDAVATIGKARHVLVLHPSLEANSLQEFIALAKSRPGQLNYASSAVGGSIHLLGELFNIMVGTKIQHIPYKGSGSLISDLVGGQVQLSFQAPVVVIPHIKSGKLKAIAVTGDTRAWGLPQVPTFAEAGLPAYETMGWYGIVAPAGTPKDVINRLSTEIAGIVSLPEVNKSIIMQGAEPFVSTPGQYAALIKADMAKLAKLIKTANVRLE